MINKADVQRILEERGVEYSFYNLKKACRQAATVEEAVAMMMAEKPQKAVDPDMADYDAYNVAIRSAHYWAGLRAEVAETASAEDLAYTAQEADEERATYSARVDECLTRAWKHFTGARRFAYPERIEFPYELSKTWKETV